MQDYQFTKRAYESLLIMNETVFAFGEWQWCNWLAQIIVQTWSSLELHSLTIYVLTCIK